MNELQREDKDGKTIRYFDGYDTLKGKLQTTKGQNAKTKHTPLAKLQILKGAKDEDTGPLGLEEVLWDTIKYVLDFDAEAKPPVRINKQPQFCSSELWGGELWLGGIADSGNWDGFLRPPTETKPFGRNIRAVVSVHPEDDLAKSYWNGLYKKWDGKSESLKEGWAGGKIGQYIMPLLDESSSDMRSYLGKAFKFIKWHLLRGENVYVHCKAGQSRSASVVGGYMCEEAMDKKCLPKSFQTLDHDTVGDLLEMCAGEFSLLPDDDKSNATQNGIPVKREGITIGTFKSQLLNYFGQQGKDSTSQPAKKKENGGYIIIVAEMMKCFVLDLKPSTELKEYWSELRMQEKKFQGQKKRFIVASKDKDEKKGITKEKNDEERLAEYDVLFEYKPPASEESKTKKSSPKKSEAKTEPKKSSAKKTS